MLFAISLPPIRASISLVILGALCAPRAAAQFHIGPETHVQAGGVDIWVPGYSVPSFAHWNDDGLLDLVVGEGSSSERGRVRVYLNEGTPGAPSFTGFFFAQSNGSTLTLPGGG
jgi:hypothetical protein